MDKSVIVAHRHGPKYQLHKYWARKPASVLGHYLDKLLTKPGTVIDPFAGSGVFLREAAERGHEAIGFDVNPIAVLLSHVTMEPPNWREFDRAAKEVLAQVADLAGDSYTTSTGRTIRYVVHALLTRCPTCGRTAAANEARKAGRVYTCTCGGRLRFNLASATGTKVVDVALDRGEFDSSLRQLFRQQHESETSLAEGEYDRYSFGFCDNSRTLTQEAMRTSDLFTVRNFGLLGAAVASAEEVQNLPLRRALLLSITGSLAQCSRLIADRGRLSTGGPAWTVPGFWVPPVHLEGNPVTHLAARFRRFERGLRELNEASRPRRASVELRDAVAGLSAFIASGRRADLIFLDPPYGDSVAYLEFSAMWNAFLGQQPDLRLDLSVSQRLQHPRTWETYAESLLTVLSTTRHALSSDGKILVTFNSLDLRAWSALLDALQQARFALVDIVYQIPAVVSAKAQFSPNGSYVGDFYATYEPADREVVDAKSARPVVAKALQALAVEYAGIAPRAVVLRAGVLAWMRSNAAARECHRLDEWIAELFEVKKDLLVWRGSLAA